LLDYFGDFGYILLIKIIFLELRAELPSGGAGFAVLAAVLPFVSAKHRTHVAVHTKTRRISPWWDTLWDS
jgi:hypothetical protein